MLHLRGRRSAGLFAPRSAALPAEAPEPEPEVTTRLPKSRIYEADPTRWSPAEGQSEDLAVKLGRRFSDRKFHSIAEICGEGELAECFAAMSDLCGEGWRFDRSGDAFRMRMRQPGEEICDPVRLAAELEAAQRAGGGRSSPPEGGQAEPEVEADPGFDPTDDAGRAAPAGHFVLSAPPADLSLPSAGASAWTSAILAKKGSGKTYLGGVLVEEMLDMLERFQVVVFDPNGVWWGLLATAAGAPSRSGILLVGGPRGHLAITARDGAALADLVYEGRPRPVVVDLSSLAPVEQHEVVADFCVRMHALPHFPLHLVIDEADEFVPQRLREPAHHQKRALSEVERVVMRGRSRGMGATLISLRPAVVAKNVLSQVDALFLLRLVEPNDLRAVDAWLGGFGRGITPDQRARCLGQLPILPVGTAYYLRGGDEMTFRRFKVRRKRSYDSSRTLVAGLGGSANLAPADPAALALAARIFGKEEA